MLLNANNNSKEYITLITMALREKNKEYFGTL